MTRLGPLSAADREALRGLRGRAFASPVVVRAMHMTAEAEFAAAMDRLLPTLTEYLQCGCKTTFLILDLVDGLWRQLSVSLARPNRTPREQEMVAIAAELGFDGVEHDGAAFVLQPDGGPRLVVNVLQSVSEGAPAGEAASWIEAGR